MKIKSNPVYHTRTEVSDFIDYEKQEVLHVYEQHKNVVSFASDSKEIIDLYLKMMHNAKDFLTTLETIKRLANINKHVLLIRW